MTNDELQRIADEVRAQKESSQSNEENIMTGCCYVTIYSGEKRCFDWDGLTEEYCKQIGQQAGLPVLFLPGQKCKI